MKTSIFQQIKEWLKVNKKVVVMAAIIIFGVIFICIREGVIKHQAAKLGGYEADIKRLQKEREDLIGDFKKLTDENRVIIKSRDSLRAVLESMRYKLDVLIQKHKREIDSLTNIPADTVYKRLQVIYPNFDGSDLRFPFSESQIKPIYNTALSYPMLTKEYSLQGKTLNTCLDLNKNYENGILNLNSQVSNLQENIKKADEQIGSYKGKVDIMGRQLSKKTFWNRVFLITTGIAAGLAILK